MSKAGIQSNRGDGYQTLVAFDWALTVLSDPNFQWLEVDSVSWSVDDVVIGKADGTQILCQCKKNQTLHKAWSISDLADELCKAIVSLKTNPKADVCFYSRSAFGDLAALLEFSANYADEGAYQADLGKANRVADAELRELLVKEVSSLSTYQFLQHTKLEITPDLERMETKLRERLCMLASNSSAAFTALWTRLDYLGMRMIGQGATTATQHRLTKDDLKTLLANTGSMLTPPMDMVEVRNSFKGTSAIGRSWRRDIGNERISSPAVSELIEAIEAKHRSILLTGLPGSGKTCVILAVQDRLEQLAQNRTDLLPLFIQSREFADMATAQERQALGLPEKWVEWAARMAENAQVVVIIDSLDVLSIAREHSVLTYFLAQIDRLLQTPNITVVTACRDFDCHYDRRIAERNWDKKIECQALGWDAEIAPLLTKLGIDASTIDAVTRQLIRNPRELALFVELAQQGGSFNVVTSHALAQRYLTTIVQANSTLGEAAMQAIEDIAAEMLKLRSLAVPRQRFTASQDIQRALLSNKVLHETQDGHLTFGHQTLLDVLVISRSVRQGITLNAFIQNLPPVPFVRPSIRGFVAQLASGDRREFRKQLRTVLIGNDAFHIRRLVAESFAEQAPLDDDWMLIRDLHNQHRDVFLVIYTQANREEWHHFWMRFLVPLLRDSLDSDGLLMHVNHISQWKNADPVGVLKFWAEMLALDGMDKTQLSYSISDAIIHINPEYLTLCAPLLVELLELPRQEYSFFGQALARCVKNGGMDDAVLWNYVMSDVSDEDVLRHHLNNKLHCQPHEFGDSGGRFLADRMQKSAALLSSAIASIERWSQIKITQYGEEPRIFWNGFLNETSFSDTHTQTDHRHIDSERILLDAIESAILLHANSHSQWWQSNRERLCFNTEGALRYIAILACISAPIINLDLIAKMLCDKALLESALSYELGTLMQTAFVYLNSATQDKILATILTLRQEAMTDPTRRAWLLRKQAELIVTIPCYLRSTDAQAVLNECENSTWPLVRQPDIRMRGGMVSAPFSFEVFLGSSDDSALRLLEHYKGYGSLNTDDFLLGGEREVGWQLREAASRAPYRFANLLSANWERIPDCFRNDLMEGVATYLASRYGNLQPSQPWSPTEEPDAEALAQQIFDELEGHPNHWLHNRAASKAIEGCAYVIAQISDGARLVSLAMGFSTLQEEAAISGDSIDLLTVGINMPRGNSAEALMILANQLTEKSLPWPETLPNALRTFAADKHPAIRALLLRRMPYLQSRNSELGWDLFGLAMQENTPGLWSSAEPCLYYAYHQSFEIVGPWLARLHLEGRGEDLETWGRISALIALSNRLDFTAFLAEIKALNSAEAWNGAASVWTHSGNMRQHREQCLAGLDAGLNVESVHAVSVAHKIRDIFRETTPPVIVPIELIQRCVCLLESDVSSKQSDIFGFDAWLNAIALRDPMHALEATEIYVAFARRTKLRLYDHGNNLTQLLTRLFAQAEEQEESDSGAMLRRVVVTQDALLALGVNGVNEWLKAAERP